MNLLTVHTNNYNVSVNYPPNQKKIDVKNSKLIYSKMMDIINPINDKVIKPLFTKKTQTDEEKQNKILKIRTRTILGNIAAVVASSVLLYVVLLVKLKGDDKLRANLTKIFEKIKTKTDKLVKNCKKITDKVIGKINKNAVKEVKEEVTQEITEEVINNATQTTGATHGATLPRKKFFQNTNPNKKDLDIKLLDLES